MTIDELIEEAASLGPWKADGPIRCEKGDCPILAVSKKRGLSFTKNVEAIGAGAALGLQVGDVMEITYAADIIDAGPVRRRMLRAFGLQERA